MSEEQENIQEELVFVIDDEDAVCRMLKAFLERSGFRVTTMTSGVDAIDLMHEQSPIAIISDIRMPDMDGLDLLSKVMAYDPDMVVILMTGAPSLDITIEALRAGATDFLPKPIDMKFLLQSLKKGVQRRHARMQSKTRQEHLEEEVNKRTQELTEAIREIQETYQELRESYDGSIELLRRASSLRDNDTGEHINRIRLYSATLAKAVGLSSDDVNLIKVASPMHDIGKIGIPDEILRCPGPLSTEQYDLMKSHTIVGHKILGGYDVPVLKASAEIALSHHERWDGSGYPHGLKGEEIPVFARIVAVVDVWDALTQSRCYKPAFDLEKSLSIMKDQSHKYDPMILEKFFEIVPELISINEEVKANSA